MPGKQTRWGGADCTEALPTLILSLLPVAFVL
jgi:hypothetical protein